MIGIIINIKAEINLAKTTPNILTGEVIINCSVPLFLSPEIDHIVSNGVININPYNAV